MERFEMFCEQLNDKCRLQQKFGKEYIDDELAVIATTVIRSLVIKSIGDLLLYCASLNALNTYVKQGNNKKSYGYSFKRNASVVADFLLKNDITGLNASIQIDKDMTLMIVNICGVQCSFHNINLGGSVLKFRNSEVSSRVDFINWDGIRKQLCAKTLFTEALQNKLYRRDIALHGRNLNDDIDVVMRMYKAGRISVSDINELHRGGCKTEAFEKKYNQKLL